jgi:tryptophan-rich sensory protein
MEETEQQDKLLSVLLVKYLSTMNSNFIFTNILTGIALFALGAIVLSIVIIMLACVIDIVLKTFNQAMLFDLQRWCCPSTLEAEEKLPLI